MSSCWSTIFKSLLPSIAGDLFCLLPLTDGVFCLFAENCNEFCKVVNFVKGLLEFGLSDSNPIVPFSTS